jgi:hypothetical protein
LYKSYKGELKDNKFDGKGTIIFTNGNIFVGNFIQDNKEGIGKMYNSSGDIIMNNIWKNNIINGKSDYIDYYHGTKNSKVIGQFYNCINFGQWIYIRENLIIDKINYYSDIDHLKLYPEKKSNEIIKELTTHNTGFIKIQKLHIEFNHSIEELCMGSFEYYNHKLSYEYYISPLKSNNEIEYNISKYAILTDLKNVKDHTMYLYQDSKGNKIKITKIINEKEYDHIIYFHKDNNKNAIFFVNKLSVNELSVNESERVISNLSIYRCSFGTNIPVIYYTGDINSSYLPHGNGTIYINSIDKITGFFEKGNVVKGILFQNMLIHYKGSFKNEKPNGEGSFYEKDIKLYDGQILNGKRNGDGISYWQNGAINWKGKWYNDKKHGKGTLYSEENILICNCIYENDQFIDFTYD